MIGGKSGKSSRTNGTPGRYRNTDPSRERPSTSSAMSSAERVSMVKVTSALAKLNATNADDSDGPPPPYSRHQGLAPHVLARMRQGVPVPAHLRRPVGAMHTARSVVPCWDIGAGGGHHTSGMLASSVMSRLSISNLSNLPCTLLSRQFFIHGFIGVSVTNLRLMLYSHRHIVNIGRLSLTPITNQPEQATHTLRTRDVAESVLQPKCELVPQIKRRTEHKIDTLPAPNPQPKQGAKPENKPMREDNRIGTLVVFFDTERGGRVEEATQADIDQIGRYENKFIMGENERLVEGTSVNNIKVIIDRSHVSGEEDNEIIGEHGRLAEGPRVNDGVVIENRNGRSASGQEDNKLVGVQGRVAEAAKVNNSEVIKNSNGRLLLIDDEQNCFVFMEHFYYHMSMEPYLYRVSYWMCSEPNCAAIVKIGEHRGRYFVDENTAAIRHNHASKGRYSPLFPMRSL